MWTSIERPGYFGRKKDEKIAALDMLHGKGQWRLAWSIGGPTFDFFNACRYFYEEAYFQWLAVRPQEVDLICQYGECYDNEPENVHSGLDYMIQRAYSTHIQDIAVRNVLRRLGRWFQNANGKLLQIRSRDSEGFRFGPGNIAFHVPQSIIQPSLCPKWAEIGSVEDFWQSNKMLQVWKPQ